MLARLAAFQSRERVILLPFDTDPGAPTRVEFGTSGDHAAEFAAIRTFAARLVAGGGTAIFSTLEHAYALAAEEHTRDPTRTITVVVLTDGENRDGISLDTLASRLRGQYVPRTFPILFGEAKSEDLERLAEMTGGRVFDGRVAQLTAVFREIRGYQ
jgi:Ca-activated chloride channel family protein